ncbi:DUF2155 domain-containing protein [Methylocystis echinoides]|uniref:DUF2155 domain-containing protein n=1 Tax=Methylocystis echinoides TaxID=29468 RepID=UPI0038620F1F
MVSSLRNGLALGAFAAAMLGVAQADPIRHPTAVFAGLDKTTGRIINFDVAIDETVQFGSLNVTPRVCNTRPQTEAPQTTSFVEVDELVVKQERQARAELREQGKSDAKPPETKQEAKRIFSGWMFASSPGLHGVEHPVYDVWLLDCKGGKEIVPPPATAGAETPAQPGADAAAAAQPDAGAPPPEAGKKRKSRKVEPKAPTPVENAPIGPADSAPPQPAVDAQPAPDAGAADAPAQPGPRKKKRKPAAVPAAQPAAPQGGGGFFPF